MCVVHHGRGLETWVPWSGLCRFISLGLSDLWEPPPLHLQNGTKALHLRGLLSRLPGHSSPLEVSWPEAGWGGKSVPLVISFSGFVLSIGVWLEGENVKGTLILALVIFSEYFCPLAPLSSFYYSKKVGTSWQDYGNLMESIPVFVLLRTGVSLHPPGCEALAGNVAVENSGLSVWFMRLPAPPTPGHLVLRLLVASKEEESKDRKLLLMRTLLHIYCKHFSCFSSRINSSMEMSSGANKYNWKVKKKSAIIQIRIKLVKLEYFHYWKAYLALQVSLLSNQRFCTILICFTVIFVDSEQALLSVEL